MNPDDNLRKAEQARSAQEKPVEASVEARRVLKMWLQTVHPSNSCLKKSGNLHKPRHCHICDSIKAYESLATASAPPAAAQETRDT